MAVVTREATVDTSLLSLYLYPHNSHSHNYSHIPSLLTPFLRIIITKPTNCRVLRPLLSISLNISFPPENWTHTHPASLGFRPPSPLFKSSRPPSTPPGIIPKRILVKRSKITCSQASQTLPLYARV
jgi:hypothetical protein